jgi:hypothetical protein
MIEFLKVFFAISTVRLSLRQLYSHLGKLIVSGGKAR